MFDVLDQIKIEEAAKTCRAKISAAFAEMEATVSGHSHEKVDPNSIDIILDEVDNAIYAINKECTHRIVINEATKRNGRII